MDISWTVDEYFEMHDEEPIDHCDDEPIVLLKGYLYFEDLHKPLSNLDDASKNIAEAVKLLQTLP